MTDKYANYTPVLETLLEPGEGGLMNIVADCAIEVKRSADKTPWQPLIDYLNSNEVSPVAKNLGLCMLGELDDTAVSKTEAEVAEWYICAAENEKRLSRVLFKSEFAEPRI